MKLDANLAMALSFVDHWEGGYVNDPDDPGKATKYGISLRWLQGLPDCAGDIDGDGDVDADDIRALTREQANELYASRFWHKPGFASFPAPVAIALFDTGVNCGLHRAVRFVQQAANECDGRLVVDGLLGPMTRQAIHRAVKAYGLRELALLLIGFRQEHYNDLASHRDEHGRRRFFKYHFGWTRRASALQQLIRTF